jgi:hypothetical protein
MADDEITLSCKIIDDESEKALIKTTTGQQSWIYRSDFSIGKLGWAEQTDQIRVSRRLAIARGIL